MSTQNFCLNEELTQNSLILLILVLILSVVLICLIKFSFNQIRRSILRFLTGLENERGYFKQISYIMLIKFLIKSYGYPKPTLCTYPKDSDGQVFDLFG